MGSGGRVEVTGDFNGDGKRDIATSTGQILLGNSDGTFRLMSQTLPSGSQDALAAGDFNKDGNPDLAFTNQLAGTVCFLNAGKGTFGKSRAYYPGAPNAPFVGKDLVYDVADFSGDAKPRYRF